MSVYNGAISGVTLDEINKVLSKTILSQIDKMGFDVKFSCIDGSLSRGMANSTSDIDVFVFGLKNGSDENIISMEADCNNQKIKIDCILYDFENVIKKYMLYKEKHILFPTMNYRTAEEKKLYSTEYLKKCRFDERPDFELTAIPDYLLANHVVNKEGDESGKWFETNYRVIDCLDLYYSRLFGNYYHYIYNEEQVLVRKYIHAIYDVFVCECIVLGIKPNKDINVMLDVLKLNCSVKEEIEGLIYKNKNSTISKSEFYMDHSNILDVYIFNSILKFESITSKYDLNIMWNELSDRNNRQVLIL